MFAGTYALLPSWSGMRCHASLCLFSPPCLQERVEWARMQQQGEAQKAALLLVWKGQFDVWNSRPDLRRFAWWSCFGHPAEPFFSMARFMQCGDGTLERCTSGQACQPPPRVRDTAAACREGRRQHATHPTD